MTNEIQKQIERTVQIADQYCKEPPLFYLGKCMEELGEFAETILVEQGFMPQKVLKENSFGETADVINCVITALRSNWPHLSTDEFFDRLAEASSQKNDKFKSIYDGTYADRYK